MVLKACILCSSWNTNCSNRYNSLFSHIILIVPGGPPAMLMAFPTVTTLILSWDPPAEPNGVIITYTLYVDYFNGTTTNLPTLFAIFLLSPLRPYQTISVQVSASTSVGEGLRTLSMEFTTAEASELHNACNLMLHVCSIR